MKKFILGFILGIVIVAIASRFWNVMPTFLGGRWDVTVPNPIASNPIGLWCNKLVDGAKEFGNTEVAVIQNGQPVSDLVVLLSTKKPPLVPYPGDSSGKTLVPFPQKACFSNTNSKGVATFKNVPVGTAYVFFNNDVAAYPKRFGGPNHSIIAVEVKNGETAAISIELDKKPRY